MRSGFFAVVPAVVPAVTVGSAANGNSVNMNNHNKKVSVVFNECSRRKKAIRAR